MSIAVWLRVGTRTSDKFAAGDQRKSLLDLRAAAGPAMKLVDRLLLLHRRSFCFVFFY